MVQTVKRRRIKSSKTYIKTKRLMNRFSFPKTSRLINNGQFKAVMARNMHASDRLLTLFMAENNAECPRLGLAVGTCFRSAVIRNRIKRLLREAFRKNQHKIPKGFDYVIMPSPQFIKEAKASQPKQAVKNLTFESIENSLLNLINRIGQKKLNG